MSCFVSVFERNVLLNPSSSTRVGFQEGSDKRLSFICSFFFVSVNRSFDPNKCKECISNVCTGKATA